mmetsp:Transcript_7544/g.18298  ORF Transcript_7544/g.18298 Transcript_7544/m.18298 type:complete len:202 (-) Transcript_7544:1093-1698(-)
MLVLLPVASSFGNRLRVVTACGSVCSIPTSIGAAAGGGGWWLLGCMEPEMDTRGVSATEVMKDLSEKRGRGASHCHTLPSEVTLMMSKDWRLVLAPGAVGSWVGFVAAAAAALRDFAALPVRANALPPSRSAPGAVSAALSGSSRDCSLLVTSSVLPSQGLRTSSSTATSCFHTCARTASSDDCAALRLMGGISRDAQLRV